MVEGVECYVIKEKQLTMLIKHEQLPVMSILQSCEFTSLKNADVKQCGRGSPVAKRTLTNMFCCVKDCHNYVKYGSNHTIITLVFFNYVL